MKHQRRMDVRHKRFGYGYIFLLSRDDLIVRFESGSQRSFPLDAMGDGTLQMSGYTRAQFQKRLDRFHAQRTHTAPAV